MNRRSFLSLVGAGATLSLAGCTSLLEGGTPDDLEDVEPDSDQLPVPTLGSGPITVDVYEDLGCPACHEFQATVFPVLEREVIDSDEITYRHYDFPVGAADESVAMANAARAVQDETRTDEEPTGAFFEYKTAVINHDDWSDEELATLAETVDVDPDAVSDALENGTYYPTLVADRNRGDDEGVDRTPTVIVDGNTVEDPTDPDAVVDAIEDAL
ncbi:thioredoxin domain-containing protein [Natronorubrum sp. JWXQ-INN-674]|uniref:Thioredoxin domain-containing protein n=1 Tax=Natronorubrum halalkaliphilum TaxID=2691917 RepID=A0A6B0VRJ5_9EURY|nr:thioredoxin domain-containing protein [Natronorubrum halalkaliphilum]MXV64148.1 thioredoxin domain-containing protein [Natronorubrum halalkaliphilum]